MSEKQLLIESCDFSFSCNLSEEKNVTATNKIELDLLDKYESIDGYRYATDKFYEEKLKNKYNYILNKTKIDSLQNKLKYYKDRLGK